MESEIIGVAVTTATSKPISLRMIDLVIRPKVIIYLTGFLCEGKWGKTMVMIVSWWQANSISLLLVCLLLLRTFLFFGKGLENIYEELK